MDKFIKYDSGKVKYHLIPPKELKQLAEILTFGAEKYGENNWQLCDDKNRYVDALYRHLEAWRSGEIYDQETGKKHLAHALTNCLFCLYFDNKENQ